jgi:hypothetical protein
VKIIGQVFSPFLVMALFVAGCAEPCPHYYRTNVVSITGQPTEILSNQYGKIRPYGSVKFFESKEEVTNAYDVVAIMTVSGKPDEEAKFIRAFLYRTADLGADGVIFERVSLSRKIEGGGWVVGQNGGFGLPAHSSEEAVYRGEAIHFK